MRIAKWLFWATGISGDVEKLCEAKTLDEQDEIWRRSLRKVFIEGWFVKWLVNNPIFLWNALGVSTAAFWPSDPAKDVEPCVVGSAEPEESFYG